MSNIYPQEILKLIIKSNSEPNSDGLFIFTANDNLSIICDRVGSVQVFDGTNTKELTDLDYTEQHTIFSWIQDNQYALRDLMREKLTDIQIDPFDEESGFVGEPQTIFAESSEGGDEVMIGKIGVVHDVTPEGDFRRVVFVSPDGSWTTLTGWYKGDDSGWQLAKSDLNDIASSITSFVNNFSYD